jgi:hypothetical protein
VVVAVAVVRSLILITLQAEPLVQVAVEEVV